MPRLRTGGLLRSEPVTPGEVRACQLHASRSRHPHRYASQAAAGSWSYVKAWVDENIMPLSRYQRGSFVLAGMWIFGRGSQPFAAPLDREYREVLACSACGPSGDYPAALAPGQAFA